MNYAEIKRLASAGIAFFSDGDGEFKCIIQAGGVDIVGGVEVEKPEITTTIKGLVRSPRVREVDGETIRIRAARLRSVADELRTAHLNKKIGTVAEVLFEDEEDGLSVGYTRAYEKVYAVAPTGKILNVKITSLYGEGLKGEVL